MLRALLTLCVACLLLMASCTPFQLPFGFVEKQARPDKAEKDSPLARPGKFSFRVAPYVFYSDFELKRDQPLFRELAELREQVVKELQLPDVTTNVDVYIFEDRPRYERFMRAKYPDLPSRRAFFVAQPRALGGGEDRIVYTYWGDRVREDLRHELTHALLHSVLKDVPLWLDEGLAEYFELPPDRKGVNAQYLEALCRNPGEPFKPSLERLEQLSEVKHMHPEQYREAWAWVHLSLRGQPEAKTALLRYLHLLRTNPNPGPLQPRLAEVFPSPEDALLRHLEKLEQQPRPASTARNTAPPMSGGR